MSSYPLFDAFPALGIFPQAGLLSGPTPLQRLPDTDDIWVKRDDLSATDYGGNKIRKLDLLLGAARADGRSEVITFGYSGSNFVAATAWHGRKLGLRTHAFLLPQVNATYLADNLATALHSGARLGVGQNQVAVATLAIARSLRLSLGGRIPRWIPPGGSTALGALGFVNAALELRAQVDAGEMPVPAQIVVAFSSMGTVAGLAIGLGLAQLPTRVIAVQVVGPSFASETKLNALIQRTLALINRTEPAALPSRVAGIEILNDYFGHGYAVPTAATRAAMQRFESATGACSDSAYSGKALAALYAMKSAGSLSGPSLYWHTFNAHGRPAPVAPLPADTLGKFMLPSL